tara:strand:+ start:502 stop:1074 length:573 start_codon:yes stop_codon:yes gene_type:complete
MKKINFIIILIPFLILLTSCNALKYKKVDAKEFPPEPEKRIQKNMSEGRGFKVFGGNKRGGEFEFANSNPLWRASLDVINFMPLLSVDYGGGLIITDWYNDSEQNEDSIKLTIQFLSNEVRADALSVKVFKKKCGLSNNCTISSTDTKINSDLKLAILKKAALYEKNGLKKKNKNYKLITPGSAERSKAK